MGGDRKGNFKTKLEEIIAHNSDTKNTWTKGVNGFSDFTFEEFKSFYHLDAP